MIYVELSVRFIQLRWRHRVGIGTNKVEELQRAVRAHGNFIEYVPLMLLMLALIEFSGVGSAWIYSLGGALTIARIAHAAGLSSNAGVSWSYGRCPRHIQRVVTASGHFNRHLCW